MSTSVLMAALPAAAPAKRDTEWQRELRDSRLIKSFSMVHGRVRLETVHYPCSDSGVVVPLSDIVHYCSTHDFLEGIYCFCEGVYGIRRAVKIAVPTGGAHLGEPSLRCYGGCSYFVSLQELFKHGVILKHMAVYPELHQLRKRKSIRDIFGSQITPRRPTGLAALSTPRSASATPRAAPSISRGADASSRPRSTSFLAPACDDSLSDSDSTASTETTAYSSPMQASSAASSPLKRKQTFGDNELKMSSGTGSHHASHAKRRRTILAPPNAPSGVRPLPPQRRRKSAVGCETAIVISDSECPVVIPPELDAILAEGSSRNGMGKAPTHVSYISDSDQERPPAQ